MKVTLVNKTEGALELLIFTKSGRLATGTTLEDIQNMTHDEKMEQLGYMMDTIKSSFEFADYTFRIEGVSRAFTHQLVRTRTASFQQEAMRVVDARDAGLTITTDHPAYLTASDEAFARYAEMLDDGVAAQDARGILPTAVHTSIFIKANLRTLSQMSELRLCKRAEGEYQKVFQLMVSAVLVVHPWAEPLLKVHCVKYGICAFPRYDKCPVQKYCFDPESIRHSIQHAWENCSHVAAPKADEKGMTM